MLLPVGSFYTHEQLLFKSFLLTVKKGVVDSRLTGDNIYDNTCMHSIFIYIYILSLLIAVFRNRWQHRVSKVQGEPTRYWRSNKILNKDDFLSQSRSNFFLSSMWFYRISLKWVERIERNKSSGTNITSKHFVRIHVVDV